MAVVVKTTTRSLDGSNEVTMEWPLEDFMTTEFGRVITASTRVTVEHANGCVSTYESQEAPS